LRNWGWSALADAATMAAISTAGPGVFDTALSGAAVAAIMAEGDKTFLALPLQRWKV